MIKVKLNEIKDTYESLKKIVDIDIPVLVSFKLSKIVKRIDEELMEFEEQRSKLVKKYGKPLEEDPDTISVLDENLEKYRKDLEKLLNFEITIENDKIKIEELADIKISAKILAQLHYIFE